MIKIFCTCGEELDIEDEDINNEGTGMVYRVSRCPNCISDEKEIKEQIKVSTSKLLDVIESLEIIEDNL